MRIIFIILILVSILGCAPKPYIILPDPYWEQARKNMEMERYQKEMELLELQIQELKRKTAEGFLKGNEKLKYELGKMESC